MLLDKDKHVLLHSIMDNSQDLITVKDLDYNYKICNRAFLKFLNIFHESNVIGKNIKNVLTPETYETILKNLDTVLETREPVIYTFNMNLNGSIQILSQLSTPVVEDGEITGILSVTRNITNEENLKLKLVEKICELNSIIEEKKQLEDQKELFLTTLTHDLKNPVQAQIMSLKLLKRGSFGELNDEQKEILETILESSDYMQKMLYSILKTYKYDNGVIYLNKEYININNLVKKCIKEVEALAASKQIKITYKPVVEKEVLYADFEQIRRVIENLINNALNYSYHNAEILVNVVSNEEKFVFKISNKGVPIESKDRVFEKYYTGNALKGVGLGLYYSKKVVEAHDGKIYLETKGDLTSFIFEIFTRKTSKNSFINW